MTGVGVYSDDRTSGATSVYKVGGKESRGFRILG